MAVLLAVTGCSGEPDSLRNDANESDQDSQSPQTTRQTQLIDNAKLANPIDMSATTAQPAGSDSCVGVQEYEFENIGDWDAKAFYTYNMEDVYREVDVNIDGGVNMEDVGVTGAFDYYYEDTTTNKKEVLALVAHVQTVKQTFYDGGADGDPIKDHCQFNSYASTSAGLANFRSDCGTGYISQETMGGYVILTARVNSVSSETKRKIDSNLNANAGPISGGLTGAINAVDSIDSLSMEFRIQTEGLPSPSSNLINQKNNGDYIQAEKVLDYISQVDQAYQAVLNDTSRSDEQKLWSSEFGQVINESYTPYAADTLKECGFANSSDRLLCYTNTMDALHKFSEDRTGFVRTLRRAQWVQNHSESDRVRWADNHNADGVSTEDLISQLEYCTQGEQIEQIKEQCSQTYRNANFSQLCEDCQIPKVCKPGLVNHNIRKWEDDFIILPPNPSTVPVKRYSVGPKVGSSNVGKHTNDWVCTLSKVHGGFFGAGESLKVAENVNGYWQIDRATARSDSDEQNFGTMHCVKQSNFYTQDSSPGGDTGIDGGSSCGIDASSCTASWTQQTFTIESNGSTRRRRMLDEKYAAALTGVKGNFGGYGEFAKTHQWKKKENDTPDSWLKVDTAANSMRGRAVSFGVDNPAPRSTPRGRTFADAGGTLRVSEQIGHIDDKFCYLTRVTGEFDGPTERARVYRDGRQWILSARSACKKNKGLFGWGSECKNWKKLKASARCYDYDQSD
jgi:hypothetical protein